MLLCLSMLVYACMHVCICLSLYVHTLRLSLCVVCAVPLSVRVLYLCGTRLCPSMCEELPAPSLMHVTFNAIYFDQQCVTIGLYNSIVTLAAPHCSFLLSYYWLCSTLLCSAIVVCPYCVWQYCVSLCVLVYWLYGVMCVVVCLYVSLCVQCCVCVRLSVGTRGAAPLSVGRLYCGSVVQQLSVYHIANSSPVVCSAMSSSTQDKHYNVNVLCTVGNYGVVCIMQKLLIFLYTIYYDRLQWGKLSIYPVNLKAMQMNLKKINSQR